MEELEDWGKNLEVKVEERTRELHRIQAQLVRSEKLASLGELVAGIAHEINNPLTGILLFSSMIQQDKSLPAATRGDMETIIRETERCARIVRGLLDFSRESMPQKTSTSVNQVMEAAVGLIRNQAQVQDITIIHDLSEKIPDIDADPSQLEQVFINILLNATHAMPKGGTLTISTEMTADMQSVHLRISDTGHGIAPENLPKIFDPFFTTKDSNGTGLGLSVSYGIINNHGGTIEVDSTVGVGTTFSIRLPLGVRLADKDGGNPSRGAGSRSTFDS